MRTVSLEILFFTLTLCFSILPAQGQTNDIDGFTSSSLMLEKAFPNLTFDQPVYITHAGDGSNRAFVVEKTGVVHVLPNTPEATSTKKFIDITEKVLPKSHPDVGETGLLSMAFHPDFTNNGKVYISYVDEHLMSIISEMIVSNDPDIADQGTERILLQMQQPQRNHNAGHVAFGPDGYLYISFGDGFSESARDGIEHGDPHGHGQNLATWFSSVLRIDVDRQDPDKAYAIPQDNPFAGNTEGWQEEIYAYGFRNPWRFSFDRETGDLWLADVGDKKAEEIDLLEPGKNYGWPLKEATHCFEDVPCDSTQWVNLEDPIFQYHRDIGESITGGYVYRGTMMPDKQGVYFYGDFDFKNIWTLKYENGLASENELVATASNGITSFGEDEDGELYVVAIGGTIWKLIDQAATNAASEDVLPDEYRLYPNYPNPFNPSTQFAFDVPVASVVSVEVVDVLGKVITTLANREFSAGRHQLIWNGMDAAGMPVASGTYFYTIETRTFKTTRSMLLLK